MRLLSSKSGIFWMWKIGVDNTYEAAIKTYYTIVTFHNNVIFGYVNQMKVMSEKEINTF